MSPPHGESNHDDDVGEEENDAEGIVIEEDGRNDGKYNNSKQINVL